MIIKTKEFQEVCKTIAIAVDSNKANIELVVKNDFLYLNVTNREYYVAVKFALAQPDSFKAVIDAQLFLNLISGITTDTFEIKIKDNTVVVKSGKSSYKLAMIYENDELAELPPIYTENKTVEMNISKDILASIVNTNGREIAGAKALASMNPLQSLYYVDETGCFTFASGACLNTFSLEYPVKLVLNDRLVKLFKLFKEDVHFSLGHDALRDGSVQTKVIFETEDIYLAAIITNDTAILSKAQGPWLATKRYVSDNYPNHLVLSVGTLSAALARLMQFTKSSAGTNLTDIRADVVIDETDITFSDSDGNTEVIPIEAGSSIEGGYRARVSLVYLKSVLDSCKQTEHITLNCGNGSAMVINHGTVSNLVKEWDR